MWNYEKAPADIIDKVRKIGAIADKHNIPIAAAALQFPLGNDLVTSVIPGPRNANELQQILNWFQTPITDDFWAELKAAGLIEGGAPVPVGK